MITVLNGNDSGAGSFRQALLDAVDGDIILFDATVTTVSLTSASLTINKELTISGPGSGSLTVQRTGGTQFRIFYVRNPVSGTPITVSISGMTIKNGYAVLDRGGGMYAEHFGAGAVSVINLTDVVFDSNQTTGAVTGSGGGLHSRFRLNMQDCVVKGNHTTYNAGGVYVNQRAHIQNLLCINNSADLACGGFYSEVELEMYNSIIGQNGSPNTCAKSGGGLFLNGDAKVEDCTIEYNTAGGFPGLWGGSQAITYINTVFRRCTFRNAATGVPAIWNELGTLVMEDCTVYGINESGFFNNHATTFLTRCTFRGVQVAAKAGVWNELGTLNLDSCTISLNAGPGIYDNGGAMDICHCTISHNGRGLVSADGYDTFQNTIFCGNTNTDIEKEVATAPSLISNGYNIFGIVPVGMGTTTGDQSSVSGADLKIDTLADNGGYTETMALDIDSPAVDAGLTSGALAGGGYTAFDGGAYLAVPPATDQRYGPRVVNSTIDIGAYETGNPSTPPTPGELAQLSRCYCGLPHAVAQATWIKALCEWANQ